ncbi:hypothetical protein SK92_00277 [Klebsiella oxytoca]|nr:hypothetical protein SK92_00277 [Klebsiella oxytoca]SWK16543.1 Uncharacterised protein [Klebsiella pneumoniae]SWK65687.1 Uncharacterised protein [Klebsiella pneumoniae]
MTMYLLLVLTFQTGRLEHIQFYTEKSCQDAAEVLRGRSSSNARIVECVKNEVPNG